MGDVFSEDLDSVTLRLKGLWLDLCEGVCAKDSAEKVFENEIVARYSRPHRSYHTLRHVAHCLDEFELATHLTEKSREIKMALFFHDAVYDPMSRLNEVESAKLAVKVIEGLGLPRPFSGSVSGLILTTKHDLLPHTIDSKLVADVDLAIFGRAPKEFKEYERRIREEYDWVSENDYKTNRVKVLQKFLGRHETKNRGIYSTTFFRDKYEKRAKKNLEKAVKKLS
ncbi:MAG: N-methyl-D-aspartate receptor NMDAR2C subunit [Nanoarchaeota archaeon]|nr:N-methyl-D-aspartate receptor NMDAR2C subunit [Nanoarchaeota archaeon]